MHCPALGGSQDTLEEGGGEEEREGRIRRRGRRKVKVKYATT